MTRLFKLLWLTIVFSFPALAAADWPIALEDKVSIHPNEVRGGLTVGINVLGNDIGTSLLVSEVNAWSQKGGRVYNESIRPEGGSITVSYSPPANFTGEDTFWYVIKDYKGRTNAAKVTVTIAPTDARFPNPADDEVSVQKDTSIRIDVLKNDDYFSGIGNISQFNDWSEKGGRINIEPEASTFFQSGNRQLIYTPPPGFTGTDTFWYVIKSKKGSGELTNEFEEHAAKVTINVHETNQAGPYPVANEDFVTAVYTCFPRYCPRNSNSYPVTTNDIGNNLKISTSSPYSLKGGTVSVGRGSRGLGVRIDYKPSLLALTEGKDTIWYTIEDEVGRKNWGVINLTVGPL